MTRNESGGTRFDDVSWDDDDESNKNRLKVFQLRLPIFERNLSMIWLSRNICRWILCRRRMDIIQTRPGTCGLMIHVTVQLYFHQSTDADINRDPCKWRLDRPLIWQTQRGFWFSHFNIQIDQAIYSRMLVACRLSLSLTVFVSPRTIAITHFRISIPGKPFFISTPISFTLSRLKHWQEGERETDEHIKWIRWSKHKTSGKRHAIENRTNSFYDKQRSTWVMIQDYVSLKKIVCGLNECGGHTVCACVRSKYVWCDQTRVELSQSTNEKQWPAVSCRRIKSINCRKYIFALWLMRESTTRRTRQPKRKFLICTSSRNAWYAQLENAIASADRERCGHWPMHDVTLQSLKSRETKETKKKRKLSKNANLRLVRVSYCPFLLPSPSSLSASSHATTKWNLHLFCQRCWVLALLCTAHIHSSTVCDSITSYRLHSPFRAKILRANHAVTQINWAQTK